MQCIAGASRAELQCNEQAVNVDTMLCSLLRISSGTTIKCFFNLRKRLQSSGYDLEVSDSALSMLGEAGFDPVYGARPLKRAIQQEIENPLAQKILSGDFTPGFQTPAGVYGADFVLSLDGVSRQDGNSSSAA